jgi:chemotaxis-related protein WspB
MLLLSFTAGPNRYAVDVARVVEVVPKVELRPLPHAPACLAGLLGYRGKVVPVIDLGLLLGTLPCRDRLSTRIILVNDAPGDHNRQEQDRDDSVVSGGRQSSDRERTTDLLGLVAEHVSELSYAQPEHTAPSPVQLAQAPYLDTVVQTEEGIVQLITIEKVRDAVLRGALVEQVVSTPESRSEPPNSALETSELGT